MTVRRDLSALEQQGIVRTFYGSVVLIQEHNGNARVQAYTIASANTNQVQQKQRIARAAAGLIEPNDVLIIDVGSTTEAMTRALPVGSEITIICYGMNILREVRHRPNTSLIGAGGHFHDDRLMFESQQGAELIRMNRYESEMKRAAIESSQTRILLVDSSKYGKVRQVRGAAGFTGCAFVCGPDSDFPTSLAGVCLLTYCINLYIKATYMSPTV